MTRKELEQRIDAFVALWLGKKIDFDGAYGGQCVDEFRQCVKEVYKFPQPKGVVGAKDFWTNYETDPNLKNYYTKIPNSPTAVPIKGDTVIWGAWKNIAGLPDNEFGHISTFIEGDVNTFTSFDQNYPTLNKCTKTKHNYTSPKVLGWLRPNTSEVPEPTPEPTLDYATALTKALPKEEFNKIEAMKKLEKKGEITIKDAVDTQSEKFLAYTERYNGSTMIKAKADEQKRIDSLIGKTTSEGEQSYQDYMKSNDEALIESTRRSDLDITGNLLGFKPDYELDLEGNINKWQEENIGLLKKLWDAVISYFGK